MVEPLQPASALSNGIASWRGEELSMRVCPPSAIVHLEGRRAIVADAMLPSAGRCMPHDDALLLSVAPDAYFRVGGKDDSASLGAWFEVVVDIGSAWTRLAFAGPKALELLRKGCAVDLHPRTFPAGACCATGFARMRVVLWRPTTEGGYEMLVGRSYAQSLWSWLIDAAAQYGGQLTEERLR